MFAYVCVCGHSHVTLGVCVHMCECGEYMQECVHVWVSTYM